MSPSKLKVKKIKATQNQHFYRKKLYKSRRKVKTLKIEVRNLKSVTNHLKKHQVMSENAIEHLKKTYEDVPVLLMSRYLKNIRNGTITHETYPAPLRDFAATLHFYSCKAYEEVRRSFALALPHQATIRKWFSHIDCTPGFITPAFEALKVKVDEAALLNREVICSIMLDEMAIKKQVEFDGKKMWGYVDIGVPCDSDDLEVATQALVIMVVAHQSHWKLPIAYFLIKNLTGNEKANLIKESIIRLHEIGIKIVTLTCDGPSAHFTMLTKLGCSLDNIHNLKTWFPNPANPSDKIYCILDICHMLKLMRNSLATLGNFKDPEGNVISWSFIEKLHELQENETLTIANKLKIHHLNWERQKMKVYLAAQTLSSSIAKALEFVNKNLCLPEFKDSQYTSEFIYKIDSLFDILNSRSPFGRGLKAPLRLENENDWRSFITETLEYLARCTDITGRPLWKSSKKTAFIGFAISAQSICEMFDDLVKTGRLKYILTYKCSQDHLEIFFSSIRSRNGWNNNPTCLQFMRSFRKILMHTQITGRGGNCKVLDTATILNVPSTGVKENKVQIDVSLCRKYNIEVSHMQLSDHDYDVLPKFIDLTEVSFNIVIYIAGYVTKMLKRVNKCMDCLFSCITTMNTVEENVNYGLISIKNRGGLHVPSTGVIKICRTTELMLRYLLTLTNNKIPHEVEFLNTFVVAVSQKFYCDIHKLFPGLSEHFLEYFSTDEHHGYMLLKQIVKCYAKIRIYNLAKRYTAIIQGPQLRRELNKLILFNHQ